MMKVIGSNLIHESIEKKYNKIKVNSKERGESEMVYGKNDEVEVEDCKPEKWSSRTQAM